MSILLDKAIYAVAALPREQQEVIARRMLKAAAKLRPSPVAETSSSAQGQGAPRADWPPPLD